MNTLYFPADDHDRFLVHFFNLSTGFIDPNNEVKNTGINIYSYDKAVYIKCEGEIINEPGIVNIYDMYGRLLTNKNLEYGSLTKIEVPVNNSFVVVRVRKGGITNTEKVFIR